MACQASPVDHTGFGSTPGITTALSASTGPDSTGDADSTTSTGGSSGDPDSGDTDSTTEPPRDLGGMPDFGDGAPIGCKGKIDLLFVISRGHTMDYLQPRLVAAFPQFMATIQAKFAEFDYHIMVVTGDGGWGNETCTEQCPTLACKVGEPCCNWNHPDWQGKLCCDEPTYPCQDLDLVSKCDRTWGAGEVFPAGVDGEPNQRCPIDGDLRYLVNGQTDLNETFACIAAVGASGHDLLGQALVAAMQQPINDPGGCNRGFLRDDALLMVTFISSSPDDPKIGSDGEPEEWAEAVLAAKHGDAGSVVMFSILNAEAQWKPSDRIGALAMMFPHHHLENMLAPDYGPAFAEAADLVETACAGFTPPG